jgi:hypothetical protein
MRRQSSGPLCLCGSVCVCVCVCVFWMDGERGVWGWGRVGVGGWVDVSSGPGAFVCGQMERGWGMHALVDSWHHDTAHTPTRPDPSHPPTHPSLPTHPAAAPPTPDAAPPPAPGSSVESPNPRNARAAAGPCRPPLCRCVVLWCVRRDGGGGSVLRGESV